METNAVSPGEWDGGSLCLAHETGVELGLESAGKRSAWPTKAKVCMGHQIRVCRLLAVFPNVTSP